MKEITVKISIPDDDASDSQSVARWKNQSFDELVSEVFAEWCEVSLDAELQYLSAGKQRRRRERTDTPQVRQ